MLTLHHWVLPADAQAPAGMQSMNQAVSLVHTAYSCTKACILYNSWFGHLEQCLLVDVIDILACPSCSRLEHTSMLRMLAHKRSQHDTDQWQCRHAILTDFFRHPFDGSGADNLFDAGSCLH